MRSELDRIVPSVDVVHTLNPFVYPTHATAKAALRHGKPLFYHQHGALSPDHLRFRSFKKQIMIRLVEKAVLSKATMLFSLTDHETQSYRRLTTRAPCEVIPNGIDVNDYWDELPSEWHDKLHIDRRHPVILFLGRIHPTKGAERLLKAFSRVSVHHPNAVLVMAGPDEYGAQKTMRQHLGAKVQERVVFPGMVSGDMKKALLARADLFCLPSDAEGFSMAVLEALASRTAVLLSPGCHFPEVAVPGAGRICPSCTEDIARTMTELLADRGDLSQMGRKGREFVSRYNWDHVIDKLLRAYERGIRLNCEIQNRTGDIAIRLS